MRNRLTQDAPTLFVDQYGNKIVARSLAELKAAIDYRGGAAKQYQDKAAGGTVWNGYVLGRRWFTAFKRAEVAQ
jgi:hypothetical protein